MELQDFSESDPVSIKAEPLEPGDVKFGNDETTVKQQMNFDLPADCLNTVSMPKNWGHVERLKQQRQLLHLQLFSQNTNSANNKMQSDLGQNKKCIDRRNNPSSRDGQNILPAQKKQKLSRKHSYTSNDNMCFADSDSCSSEDELPRLQIADLNDPAVSGNDELMHSVSQGNVFSDMSEYEQICENRTGYKEQKSGEDSNENLSQKSLDCSDLCDLSASGINEALHKAIFSVNSGQREEKNRIKKVLQDIKMKADEKEHHKSGYRISKAVATNTRSSKSLNCSPKTSVGNSVDEIENCLIQNSNIQVKKENCAGDDLTKYVGLAVNVDSIRKDVDFRNIALQKYLAEKRLTGNHLGVSGCKDTQGNLQISQPSEAASESVPENGMSLGNPIKTEPCERSENGTGQLQSVLPQREQTLQTSQIDKAKQLRELNFEVYKKRLDAEKMHSFSKEVLDAQKKLLDSEKVSSISQDVMDAHKKLFEARKKQLNLELKLAQHKLQMIKKGVPVFDRLAAFRNRLERIRRLHADEETDDDIETSDDADGDCNPEMNGATENLQRSQLPAIQVSTIPEHVNGNGEDLEKETATEKRMEYRFGNSKLKLKSVQNINKPKDEGFLANTNLTTIEKIDKEETACEECLPKEVENTANSNSSSQVDLHSNKKVAGSVRKSSQRKSKKSKDTRNVTVKASQSRSKTEAKAKNISPVHTSVSTNLVATVEPSSTSTNTLSGSNPLLESSSNFKDSTTNQSAARVVIPQATVAQVTTKSVTEPTSNIRASVQGNTQIKSQTERFILPSGLVKDESTNKVFHTYHLAGNTFAMIDNKLYQIHLRNSDAGNKTFLGSLMPTIAATMPGGNIRPIVNPMLSKQLPAVSIKSETNSISTSSVVCQTSINTAVSPAKILPNVAIRQRIPGYITQSASRGSQPLNFVIMPSNTSSVSAHSIQIANNSLIPLSGENIRHQLQMNLMNNANRTSNTVPISQEHGVNVSQFVMVPSQGMKTQSGPANASTLMSSPTFQLRHPLLHRTTTSQLPNVTPTKSQLIVTSSQLMKSRVSPISKSLLTNKTYVMVNSAPVMSTSALEKTKLSTDVTPTRFEYCGSVKINPNTDQNTEGTTVSSQSKITQEKFSFTDNCVGSKPGISKSASAESTGLKHNHVVHTKSKSEKSISNIKTEKVLNSEVAGPETNSNEKQVKKSKECSVNSVPTNNLQTNTPLKALPSKVCSSMDSYIHIDKRRRGQVALNHSEQKALGSQPIQKMSASPPLEMLKETEDSMQPKLVEQKNMDSESKENSPTQHEKICDPVPFLDYPARIVSLGKSGGSSKMKGIVASPRDKTKKSHSANSSLDEEKMAQMISFANMLEEQRKEKECQKKEKLEKQEKGCIANKSPKEKKSKKRLIDTEKDAGENRMDIDEDESNAKIKSPYVPETEITKTAKRELVTPLSTDTQQNEMSNMDAPTNEGRNMFDKFHEIMSGQNTDIDSCNDSDDPYDSSDLENYEKFVTNQNQALQRMKPKSQFIKNFYASKITGEINGLDKKNSVASSQSVPDIASSISDKNNTSIAVTDSGFKYEMNRPSSVVAADISTKSPKQTTSRPQKEATQSVSQKSIVTMGGRQVKRFIKTKFIILKGDICDRWFAIKKKTGFGEMSDPKFIHYLLRLEEERQTKMSEFHARAASRHDQEAINGNKQLTTEDKVPEFCSVDINNNNNNNAYSSGEEREWFCESVEDEDDTLINVTDTPDSSPRLPDIYLPNDDCQTSTERHDSPQQNNKSSEPVTSIEERLKVVPAKVTAKHTGGHVLCLPHSLPMKPPGKVNSRKRKAASSGDASGPLSAKRPVSIMSNTTRRQMRWAVSLFREWLKETGELNAEFEYKDASWLDEKLALFYSDALSHEGTPYSTDILQMFRRSLSLFLSTQGRCDNIHISIAQDPEYSFSNSELSSLMLAETKMGKLDSQVCRLTAIDEEDLEKLYSSKTLSDDSPTHLLWKAWFDITYHLCKGKLPKNFWRSLTKRSLVLESDENGVFYMFADYIHLPPDEEPSKMYATPEQTDRCPVRSTSLYLSKLSPHCEMLFQSPKTSWEPNGSWYLAFPLSRENLEKIISQICQEADLSKIYNVSSVILTAKQASRK